MIEKSSPVNVDDVFVSVTLPRREWRITQCDGVTVRLERLDRPTTIRYLKVAELLDLYRYSPKGRDPGH